LNFKVFSGILIAFLILGVISSIGTNLLGKVEAADARAYIASSHVANASIEENASSPLIGVETFPDISNAAKGSDEEAGIAEHKISQFELGELKSRVGVYVKGRDYSQLINGYGTGLRPPTDDEWARIAENAYVVDSVTYRSSPPSVDQSAKPWFPPIGNQDGEGSCVAWAVGYYVKTFQEAKEHAWNFSGAAWEGGYSGHPTQSYQNRIISPAFIYNLINNGVDAGSSFYSAMQLVCFIGASSWEKMPYNPTDYTTWPSEEAWTEAPLYRGNSSGYQYMDVSTSTGLANLKNWIASDHLAVIGVDADNYTSLTSADFWTLDNYVNPTVNHANTIVGYDDNVAYTENGQTRYGAFKVANSWGVGGWENVNDGFYWISYEAMKQRVGYCMFYYDLVGYKPQLAATFRISHDKRNECDIAVGLGDPSAPIITKSFSQYVFGGSVPFCSNNILFDITEFKNYVPTIYNQLYFLKVYDGGSSTVGSISKFAVEYADSIGTPCQTINGNYVYLNATLPLLETTWTEERLVNLDQDSVDQKIAMATDSSGNMYVAYADRGSLNQTAIFVRKSSDRGATWPFLMGASDSSHDLGYPSIATDPYNNEIYVAFEREWASNDHDIWVLRFVNGTWSSSPVANTLGSDDRFPSVTCEYQYGSGNFQYISYEYVYNYDDRDLMFAKSTDHGATWAVTKLHGDWPDYNVHAQTSIANAEGNIYIAYKWGADYDSLCEIRVERSTDFGGTWTQFSDVDGLPNDCQFPSIAATHGGDAVVVGFQYKWSASNIDIWYSYSTNKGSTWTKGQPLFTSGLEDEKSLALVVDGEGTQTQDVRGFIHAVCNVGRYAKYRATNCSQLTNWSVPKTISDGWIGKGLAITVRPVNDTYYPNAAWTDARTKNIYCSAASSIIPSAPAGGLYAGTSNPAVVYRYIGGAEWETLTPIPASENVSIQSPHPYSNNYNAMWNITRSGATAMKVHFTYIRTESGYDYVYVKNGNGTVINSYSGSYDDTWSSWVSGNTILIQLLSDYSITYDGFVIDKLQVAYAGISLEFAVLSLVDYDGYLYAGTMSTSSPSAGIGRVYRYDGTNVLGEHVWTMVGDNMDDQVSSLVVFRDKLYAGTAWGSGRLYRYESENNWTRVVDYTGWSGMRTAYVWNDTLYLGDIGFDQIGRYNGTTFQHIMNLGGSCIYDFELYGGYLYACAYLGTVYRSSNGDTWNTVLGSQGNNMWELETFEGYLYMGMNSGELQRFNGATKEVFWTAPDDIISMVAYEDQLFIGTGGESGAVYESSTNGIGKVYCYDETHILAISNVLSTGGVQVLYVGTRVPLRFDFGMDSSPVEPGYTQVLPSTTYSTLIGHGWDTSSGLDSRDRGAPDNLKRDFVFGSSDHTFNVDLANGYYNVTLVIGDNSYAHDLIDVYADGVLWVNHLTVGAGTFSTQTFNVSVNDGQLNLKFHDAGGTDVNWVINAITVRVLAYTVHLESRQDDSSTFNKGQIVFDGTPHNLPTYISKSPSAYAVTYNSESGYEFLLWETSGGLSVSDPNARNTTATVSSFGTLRAIYKKQTVTTVSVTPSNTTVEANASFSVNVTVANVTDMYAWQVKLCFDPAVLNCTDAWLPPNHVFTGRTFVQAGPAMGANYVMIGASLIGNEPAFNGSGILCQIKFLGLTVGSSPLQFDVNDTYLLNRDVETIPCLTVNGEVTVLSRSRHFDFGTGTSPVEEGYVRIDPSSIYSSLRGYGWEDISGLYCRDRGSPDNLRRDFVFSSGNATFTVDVPNGDYLVMVVVGDQSFMHDNIYVYAEGVLQAVISVKAGEFVQKVFTVSVTDGALDLTLLDAGGSDSNWVINALIVERYAERKFDFGTDSSAVEAGYTQVLSTTLYSEDTGFGWVDTSGLWARDRGSPDALRRDFVFSSSNRTFRVDVPNGKYMVQVIVGDNAYSHDNVYVYAEGVLVVSNLTVEAGRFAEVVFYVEVWAGHLELTFIDGGGKDANWVVNCIYVKSAVTLNFDFDFGTNSSLVEAGFLRVAENTVYSPSIGYGWSAIANLQSRDRGAPDALRRDFVFSSVDGMFKVDVANGMYQVTLVVGDANSMHDKMDIYAEGVLAVGNITVPPGTFKEVTFTVSVNDGQLTMVFHDGGGVDSNWVINALSVEALV